MVNNVDWTNVGINLSIVRPFFSRGANVDNTFVIVGELTSVIGATGSGVGGIDRPGRPLCPPCSWRTCKTYN